MKQPAQNPREVGHKYGDARNPRGINVPSFVKLKLGPTLTFARRPTHKQFTRRTFPL
jgi:hypothetical protein